MIEKPVSHILYNSHLLLRIATVQGFFDILVDHWILLLNLVVLHLFHVFGDFVPVEDLVILVGFFHLGLVTRDGGDRLVSVRAIHFAASELVVAGEPNNFVWVLDLLHFRVNLI